MNWEMTGTGASWPQSIVSLLPEYSDMMNLSDRAISQSVFHKMVCWVCWVGGWWWYETAGRTVCSSY